VEFLVGQILAERYEIDAILGEGGMAVVFQGHHLELGHSVAIKVLKPEYTASPELAARFEREARTAAAFDHPNCRSVHDYGVSVSGQSFMVMPLLHGRELSSVVGHLIPASQCVALAMQVLAGLEHVHRHGVVHRDLKPDNIFVTRDANGRELLKIVDFGIARVIEPSPSDSLRTKIGAVVGTPAYMSPEQALGHEVDGRADLYSAGVMTYELLLGHLPFQESDPQELMRHHVVTAVPDFPPTVPPPLAKAITTLLAKERVRRFPDASTALEAFGKVAHLLRFDATPWVPLLELGPIHRASPSEPTKQEPLHAMDSALRKILGSDTPVALGQLDQAVRTEDEES